MSKKIFILIVVLMSISLIGIISVQVFWVQNAIETREKQFSDDVNYALAKVSENIYKREFSDYYDKLSNLIETKQLSEGADISKFIYQQINPSTNETFTYAKSILEENYKVPNDFFEDDSLIFKKIFSKEDVLIVEKKISDRDLFKSAPSKETTKFKRLTEAEKAHFEDYIRISSARIPIHKRVSNNEIRINLEKELLKRGVDTDFKYGVYSNGLATKIKSGYFRIEYGKSYHYPLFAAGEEKSNYELYVTFPEKKQYILSNISKILILSTFFIFIIILAFTSSLYQMLKQKKISEIKTDFINNMTHEFKTPIATINLALDAIKNPKIIDDKEKVRRYVKMIRDENVRMHAQVENVLRISKLEKNQLDVSKEALDLHDIIDEAITHVHLLINDKEGYIKTHFKAMQSEVLGNQFHLTNVIVNMLENAIKYSNKAPEIDVYTESTNKYLILKIKDKGIGMSKSVQKNIFDKFYREQRGNIHDVKGHGLGLSYVKEIIDNHDGIVLVESEKGKGSTFTVKLQLI